jgi:hypothetical protein
MGKIYQVTQFGDGRHKLQTRDAASKDMLLTTSARLSAEPAPKPAAGDFGVRLTGNAGKAPQQVDTDAIWAGIESNITKVLGMLSASEVAKIRASMAKYCGAQVGRTNSVGITASDQARTNDLTSSQRDSIQSMNSDSKAFWDKQFAETDRAIFGR